MDGSFGLSDTTPAMHKSGASICAAVPALCTNLELADSFISRTGHINCYSSYMSKCKVADHLANDGLHTMHSTDTYGSYVK